MLVQHQDVNIGPAAYKHLEPDELLITKIFWTIQGEGPYAGRPAIFVRFAGCNRGRKLDMGCPWCDSFFGFGQGKRMTFEQVIDEMLVVFPEADVYPLVVLTGGEPMIQPNLTNFIAALNLHGLYNIQIESNGDFMAKDFVERDSITQDVTLVVSPKTIGPYKLLSQKVSDRADCLKFLIEDVPGSNYYDVPEYAHAFKGMGNKVYLSPMAVYLRPHEPGQPVSAWDWTLIDRSQTRKNYRRAAELAMKYCFNISIQQQLFYECE